MATTTDGVPNFKNTLTLTGLLASLEGTTDTPLQCSTTAALVQIIARSNGVPAMSLHITDISERYVGPSWSNSYMTSLKTLSLYSAGATGVLAREFPFHEVATYGFSNPAKKGLSAGMFGLYPYLPVYDACMSETSATSASFRGDYLREYVRDTFNVSANSRATSLYYFSTIVDAIN